MHSWPAAAAVHELMGSNKLCFIGYQSRPEIRLPMPGAEQSLSQDLNFCEKNTSTIIILYSIHIIWSHINYFALCSVQSSPRQGCKTLCVHPTGKYWAGGCQKY